MPDIELPDNAPKQGYYYHYKHDPNGSINNYAYRIDRLGLHTETGEVLVIYRPLYVEAKVFQLGRFGDVRPLSMFMEEVEKGGKRIPRFQRIENYEVMAKLRAIFEEMYPEERWPGQFSSPNVL
ncbi:DUF1653 domain-containing protein [Candidatus Parcubacteria bacterium]|nr:DUF1653 domain-containing protein [Candidatus Parcubacteria bacterium]